MFIEGQSVKRSGAYELPIYVSLRFASLHMTSLTVCGAWKTSSRVLTMPYLHQKWPDSRVDARQRSNVTLPKETCRYTS